MKRAKTLTETPQYLATAERAAEQERVSNYGVACKLWAEAAKFSANLINQYWAESRSEFCLVRQLRTPG